MKRLWNVQPWLHASDAITGCAAGRTQMGAQARDGHRHFLVLLESRVPSVDEKADCIVARYLAAP
eukprot:363702-Chlamydomonas_euryale.AAC.7